MDFEWANDYPELQKVCQQFSMMEICNPKRVKCKNLPSIIQEGPTCGLVALAMCNENFDNSLVDNIFAEAKKRNYTNNGEMFSANSMYELARTFLKQQVELYEGNLKNDKVVDFLFNGGLLIVPYDTTGNHYPGKYNGQKAHWATISGIIETITDIYVVAKQGKSKRIMIWNLKDLDDSNSQLNEVCSDRLNSGLNYIVPEGGLAGGLGLNNKCIFVYPK